MDHGCRITNVAVFALVNPGRANDCYEKATNKASSEAHCANAKVDDPD